MSEKQNPTGLSTQEAEQRLQQYGPNALIVHKVSTLLKLLGYFWGPIPWMIEVAALLSALDWLHLDVPQVQTYVFMKMAVAGHLVLFVARTKGHFWKRPWPAPIMVWSAVITKVAATLLAAYGFGLITPIGWPEIALIWGYSIASAFVTDVVKILVYRHLAYQTPGLHRFMGRVKEHLIHHHQIKH